MGGECLYKSSNLQTELNYLDWVNMLLNFYCFDLTPPINPMVDGWTHGWGILHMVCQIC